MKNIDRFAECRFSEVRRIAQASVRVRSNLRELVYIPEYVDHELQRRNHSVFHLSNGWGPSRVMPEDSPADATLHILQDSAREELEFFRDGEDYYLSGPVLEREKTAPDRRYTIYGTGGLLTKIMPAALEARNVSCLHATSVYHPGTNHVMVFVGGPGAGKTILMLESCLRRGYRLVTTEYTHFETAGNGVRFYPGSVFDNVRAGNLVYNYTEYEKIWGKEILDSMPPGSNPWSTKVALDMTPLQPDQEVIVNPEVSLVFVKIEGQRDQAVVESLKPSSTLFQLYLNAAELINRPRLFYGTLPVPSFDDEERAKRRFRIVTYFLNAARLRECTSLFAGVDNAWIWD